MGMLFLVRAIFFLEYNVVLQKKLLPRRLPDTAFWWWMVRLPKTVLPFVITVRKLHVR